MPRIKLNKLNQLYGTSEAPQQTKTLKLGALEVELKAGNLGRLAFAGVEVLRGVSYLVRDENWGTCAFEYGKITHRKTRNAITVAYAAKAIHGNCKIALQARIEITSSTLVFTVTATPDLDVWTNRTGFVVLHPIAGVAGKPLIVTHVDGTVTRARFPKLISPGQPFFNIRSLTHKPASGLNATVELMGDKFEMEDQRNWSDASFKTYVRSLLDPWPYVLKAKTPSTQKIVLTISGKPKKQAVKKVTSDKKLPQRKRPQLGLSVSPDDVEQSLANIARLRELRPDFISCFVDEKTSSKTLKQYARLAEQCRLPVSMELVLPGKTKAMTEVQDFAQSCAKNGFAPTTVVITQAQDLKSFQPTDRRPWGPSYRDMARAARKHFPNAIIGGGMISFFTELNRKPPPQDVFDFITHSLCPIVHDASDDAVRQTLETLPHIFASTKALIGNTPYHLGPTTIAARMNPYGAGLTPNPDNRRVCLASNDPRQFGTFAVEWNLALIREAARAGIKRVTLGGLCGSRGLLNAQGKPSPLFYALKQMLG